MSLRRLANRHARNNSPSPCSPTTTTTATTTTAAAGTSPSPPPTSTPDLKELKLDYFHADDKDTRYLRSPNLTMLRALSRSSASIRSGRSKTQTPPPSGAAQSTPASLDPSQPSEPAQPCVFTDDEIRTTGNKDSTADVHMDTTTATGDTQRTGAAAGGPEGQSLKSLRRFVPNETSSPSSSSSSTQVEPSADNKDKDDKNNEETKQSTAATTAAQKKNPKRKASWYSWMWNDTSSENSEKKHASDTETETPAREDSSESVNESMNTDQRSWAFWSRGNQTQGEIAIKGTRTEEHPRSINEPLVDAPAVKRAIKPNIVAPTITDCYPLGSQAYRIKSSISKLGDYLVPKPHKIQEFDSLMRCGPKRIKRAVVIGVHGFFPAKVVRSILGEPTGTSIKFANEGAAAVQRWADEKGFDVEIEKIALEGEGKVLERVENLYQLLHNWMDLIHQADFIYFAAHSQGTPVAVHLLARLVEDGHAEKKKLALLGMAGISLGPVPGLDSRLVMRAYSSIESASLSELFQFQKLDSLQSRKYLDSLRAIINHGAKIVFVGSMNDQLVPLYSSTCVHIAHPNIYRAVYVDGQDVVAPEFLSTLLSLALHLHNIGSSDHDVVKELSQALTGPLTGGGHSKIYNETRVYDMTVRHALETTTASAAQPVKVDHGFAVPSAQTANPYVLPWCMRGLMHEATSRNELHGQLEALVDEFERWKPEGKPLKDVKYRLGAIKSHNHLTNRPKL